MTAGETVIHYEIKQVVSRLDQVIAQNELALTALQNVILAQGAVVMLLEEQVKMLRLKMDMEGDD